MIEVTQILGASTFQNGDKLATEGTVLDERIAEVDGIIRFPFPLMNLQGRAEAWWPKEPPPLFDPVEEYQNCEPNKRDIWFTDFMVVKRVEPFTKLGITFVPRIHRALNNVVKAIIDYGKTEDPVFLQGAYNQAQDTLAAALYGKGGIFNRHIFGVRRRNSTSFICTGSSRLKWYKVGLPLATMRAMNVKSGDWVMLHRCPIQHELSVLLLQVMQVEGEAGQLPWIVFKGLGADCVAGSTPLVLRQLPADQRHNVVESFQENSTPAVIDTIVRTNTEVRRLDQLAPTLGTHVHDGLQVLNHRGEWVNVKSVIQKRPRKLLEIMQCHGGVLRVTQDHEVKVDGLYRKVSTLRVGDTIDIQPTGQLLEVRNTSIYPSELVWSMGLFIANGFANQYLQDRDKKGDTRYEFRLSNNNISYLERAREAMADWFGIAMSIQRYGSPTDKHISHLVASGVRIGQKKELVLWLLQNFYDSNYEKTLPPWLFTEPTENVEAFIDGMRASGGNKSKRAQDEDTSDTIVLSVNSIPVANQLRLLADRLGWTYTVQWEKDREAVSVALSKSCNYKHAWADQITAIREIPAQPVYDVVAEGEFVAGSFNVHNCDGDPIYAAKVETDNLAVQQEIEQVAGIRTQEVAQYTGALLMNNQDPVPDYDNFQDDTERRTRPNGLSIGPADLLGHEEAEHSFLQQAASLGVKATPEDFGQYVAGIDEGKFEAVAEEVLESLALIKLRIGFVGRAGHDAMIISFLGDDQDEARLRAACYFKEKFSNQLFDCKHGSEVMAIDEVVTLLNRRDDKKKGFFFKKYTLDQAEAAMVGYGFDSEKIRPLMERIWSTKYGLSTIVKVYYPAMAMVGSPDKRALNRILQGNWDLHGIGADMLNTLKGRKDAHSEQTVPDSGAVPQGNPGHVSGESAKDVRRPG